MSSVDSPDTLSLAQDLSALHAESFAWAMVLARGNRELACEALQRAYEKLLSGAVRPRGDTALKSFLFGVIRVTTYEEKRRFRRFFERFLSTEADAPAQPSGDTVEARVIWQCLAELPNAQREVLHLVFYADLTLAEAATAMQIQVGSASQHYARGKTRLASLLREKGFP